MIRLSAIVLASLAGAAPVPGADHVVPLGYDSTTGTTSFTGPLAVGQRTYQLLIHSDQLVHLVGTELAALAWRNAITAPSAWPPADTTYGSYEVFLSGSVAPADRALVFAANVVGTQTRVRAGPLLIPAGSYTIGATAPSPNAFGPRIEFDTPWLYTGGHLLVEIRHLGSDGGTRANDGIGTAIAGYGTQFSACWQATGNVLQGNFSVVQLSALEPPACYGNCDQSTTAPVLNVADFTCFLQRFAAGEGYANCDQSTTAPVLNVADFTCFLQSFAAGCG